MASLNTTNINAISRMSRALGPKITNETAKQAIEAIGTAAIAPAAIILSPGPNTKESKNEKKYQALRQIPSIVLKYGLAFVVALLVGKKIQKAAWKGFLPNGMKSKLCFNLDKFKKVEAEFVKLQETRAVGNDVRIQMYLDDLLKQTGLTNISDPLKAKIKELLNLSQQIPRLELGEKHLRKDIMNILEPVLKTDISRLQREKELVEATEGILAMSSGVSSQSKVLFQKKEQFKKLIEKLKFKKNQSTQIFWDIRDSSELAGKKLEVFDSFVKEYQRSKFILFKQLVQFGIAICTLPVSAYLLNVIYPPFVKLAAPKLAKEVEEANR